MRRTKRFASFALAACMGVSLLVNVPVRTVSAAEPEETVTSQVEGLTEEAVPGATGTDAEALDEGRETVYNDASDADEDGFEWSGTTLVEYVGKGGDVKIPGKCTRIGAYAFDGCSGLTSIEIPASVTSIGDNAFLGCGSDLTSITVAKENKTYNSKDNCNAIIETKTNRLIQGCKNTKIPGGVTSIGDNAFSDCSGLTSIEIPTSVTSIGEMAFWECDGLTSIEIPSSVTSIGHPAFGGHSGITSIVVSSENPKYNSEGNCNAIIDTETKELILGCKDTKIPLSVTSIGERAFSGCSGMANIEIPSSITSIGDCAFWGCSGMTSIEIPSSVTSIGHHAFFECSGMTSIKISSGVTSIGEMAFYGCGDGGLTSIEIPSSVTSIGDYAFVHSGLKTIYGTSGSYAETYAKENGYEFIDASKKDEDSDEDTKPEVVADVTTSYRTHVQKDGWQGFVTNGTMSGTSGQAKRLEGIEISVSGNKNLGIQYSTHCQTYGWLPWSSNGEMNGTTGEAKRLEAIKIQLTGADKDRYDVYYRVHAQSYGWRGWAKNGEPSGTAGYAKRLEGIQIVVVKKDGKNMSKAPGLDYAGVSASKGVHDSRAYIAKTNGTITIPGSADSTNIMYKTHVQSFGWQNWVLNGAMSGTSGKAKRLEGINIKLSNAAYAGGIQYRTHVQTYGWEKEWRKDGAMSGTSGKAKRLEAIQIKLYGEMANHFDVYYRVHAQSYGWLGWAKNGEEAGTAGYAKRLEGIQIVLVPKGSAAPANNYKNIQSVNTKAYIKK